MLSHKIVLLLLLIKASDIQMISAHSLNRNCLLRSFGNTFLSEYKSDLKSHPSSVFTQTENPRQLNYGSDFRSRFRKWNLARGRGMAFPSLETTLLTLSFLTFAVYLVNLIQVLIQGMKGNNSGN